jgi:hypothetical protein
MNEFIQGFLVYILMLNQQLNKFVMCWILIWPFQIFLVMILGIQPNIRSDINNSVQ